MYGNDPRFLDRQDWTDIADSDQIAPLGSPLFTIRSTSFGCICQMLKPCC